MQRVLTGLTRVDSEGPAHRRAFGVFRVLCRTLEIVETEGPVSNALPLRFVPLAEGGWKLEDVGT
jgi:hypothetical protein